MPRDAKYGGAAEFDPPLSGRLGGRAEQVAARRRLVAARRAPQHTECRAGAGARARRWFLAAGLSAVVWVSKRKRGGRYIMNGVGKGEGRFLLKCDQI